MLNLLMRLKSFFFPIFFIWIFAAFSLPRSWSILILCETFGLILLSSLFVNRSFVQKRTVAIFKIITMLVMIIASSFYILDQGTLDQRIRFIGILLSGFLLFTMKSRQAGTIGSFLLLPLTVIILQQSAIPYSVVWSILIILLLLAKSITIYSSMDLRTAFIWLLQRAIRKETLFAITMFLGLLVLALQVIEKKTGFSRSGVGLSNELKPSSIEDMARGQALAMIIQFSGNNPVDELRANSLYFRNSTLEHNEGLNWLQGSSRINFQPRQVDFETFKYSAILSPRYKYFLPVIDGTNVVVEAGGDRNFGRSTLDFRPTRFSKDWQVFEGYAPEVDQGVIKAMNSLDQSQTANHELNTEISESEVSKDLVDLAGSLKTSKHARDFITNLEAYFRGHEFRYQLDTTSVKTLDDFLFRVKAGHCGYYSSASAVLARLAGFQARAVNGFLGGVYFPKSRQLLVRDLDAHAWAEIWDESSQSWIRIDPTAYIGQSRVQKGAEAWLRQQGLSLPTQLQSNLSLWSSSFFVSAQQRLGGIGLGGTDKVLKWIVDRAWLLVLVGSFGTFFLSFWTFDFRGWWSRIFKIFLAYKDPLERLSDQLKVVNLQKQIDEPTDRWLLRLSFVKDNVSTDLLTLRELYLKTYFAKNQEDLGLNPFESVEVKRLLKAIRKELVKK
ncbi:MAG: hypothetical protein NT027_18255 [Proteobacteria bacterium]|nr:hypothetical protein [Pseudomonadota bacterium]